GPRPPRSQIRERGSLTPANHRPRLRLTSASFAGTSRPEGSGCIPPRALDLCCRSQKRGSLAQRNDVRQTRRWVRKTRISVAVYSFPLDSHSSPFPLAFQDRAIPPRAATPRQSPSETAVTPAERAAARHHGLY